MTKSAMITGATGGIGSAISRRLASDGLAVTIGYHSAESKARSLLDELGDSRHEMLRVDVSEPDSLTAMAAHFDDGLDVLVNCAGVTRPVPHDDLDGLDDELIDHIFATNWRGPFACVRALRPALQKRKSAVVINISSIAAVTGQGSNVAYCASKAALDSMTRSLGRALAPDIRFVSVSPGWVMGEYAERMDPAVLSTQREATPMASLASPENVGAAVSAVIADLVFTTGAVISVDGGRQLGVS